MTINLEKGQRISLSKAARGLAKIKCGLGWDVGKKSGAFSNVPDYDLDASVICLNGNGKLDHENNIIYFGNLSHSSGGITHLGDNITGAGEGDDEQVIVDLTKIPTAIARLVFTVNIYDCIARQQEFAQVQNAFVRLVNVSNNQEIARYNLSGAEYKEMTGMIMVEIYRDHHHEWKMTAIGNGVKVNGLGDLAKTYT